MTLDSSCAFVAIRKLSSESFKSLNYFLRQSFCTARLGQHAGPFVFYRTAQTFWALLTTGVSEANASKIETGILSSQDALIKISVAS